MSTQTVERDTIERPTVNGWRQRPSPGQVRYATDLCRSELSYADRMATIASFPALDSVEMSTLIDRLAAVRKARMKRLRREVHGKRR